MPQFTREELEKMVMELMKDNIELQKQVSKLMGEYLEIMKLSAELMITRMDEGNGKCTGTNN